MRWLWRSAALWGSIATSLNVMGCDWWSEFKRERDQNFQREFAEAVIPGATDFHTLMFDSDTWIVWFEYHVPTNVAIDQGAAVIVGQIAQENGCFQRMKVSVEGAHLRCTRGSAGFFREYRIQVEAQTRTVRVMYADIDDGAELAAYPNVVRDFEKLGMTQ